ncbi:MAG: hypothetical protein HYX68_01990 [Planctomycetes bacterium]|nr:hypothetical protein [Planctomycetota bacterium]
MSTQLQESAHLDEPLKAKEYADAVTRVVAERRAVVLKRNGTDVAAIIPFEYLELLEEAMARERAVEIARKVDWDRLVTHNPPPQAWFDGDEVKPF